MVRGDKMDFSYCIVSVAALMKVMQTLFLKRAFLFPRMPIAVLNWLLPPRVLSALKSLRGPPSAAALAVVVPLLLQRLCTTSGAFNLCAAASRVAANCKKEATYRTALRMIHRRQPRSSGPE